MDNNERKYLSDMITMQAQGASKQNVAYTKTQYNNLLVDMEKAFGDESEHGIHSKHS